MLIELVASTFAKFPQHRSRDDTVIVLLKSETLSDSWPLDLLTDDDGVVRLRHHARRLTASAITELDFLKRFQELSTQMKLAIQNLCTAEVELVIYSAILMSCSKYFWGNSFQMDLRASIDAQTILPVLFHSVRVIGLLSTAQSFGVYHFRQSYSDH